MSDGIGLFKKIKIYALSVLLGLIISTVFITISAVAAANIPMPHTLYSAFSTIALTLGCIGAGFMSGMIYKTKGLIHGVITAAALYLLLFLISLAVIGEIGLTAVFKLFLCLFSGAIGGILGVNKR